MPVSIVSHTKTFPGCWIQVPLGYVPAVYQEAKFSWATGPFLVILVSVEGNSYKSCCIHWLRTSIDEDPGYLVALLRKLGLFFSQSHFPTQPDYHQNSGA